MIQRVQSLYLLLVLIALVALSFGSDILVAKTQEKNQYEVYSYGNVFGIQKDIYVKGELTEENLHALRLAIDQVNIEPEMIGVSTYKFPFYLFTIILSLLTLATIFGYKNLKRQQTLARTLFVLNLALFITVVSLSKSLSSNIIPDVATEDVVSQLGFGFYSVCIATAFSFMALLGIRRDVKLIKSLDRLR